MHIIILGDSIIAQAIAKELATGHDISLIGEDKETLINLDKHSDCQIIVGNPLSTEHWQEANMADCELVICLCRMEEQNIIASQVISNMYPLIHTLCSVSLEYYAIQEHLFSDNIRHRCLSSAHLMAKIVKQLLKHRYTEEIISTADGIINTLNIIVEQDAPIVGKDIQSIHKNLAKPSAIVGHYRDGEALSIQDNTICLAKDELLIAVPESYDAGIIHYITGKQNPYEAIMLAGGSSVTQELLNSMDTPYQITVIEPDLTTARRIAEQHQQVTVIHGDINDTALLDEEELHKMDALLALSEDDENNLVCALQGCTHKVPFVAATIKRESLIPLIEHSPIDLILSPQQILLDAIFKQITPKDVHEVHKLSRHTGFIMEISVPEHLDGKKESDWNLPKNSVLFGLIREKQVLEFNENTMLRHKDKVHIFAPDKAAQTEIFAILK